MIDLGKLKALNVVSFMMNLFFLSMSAINENGRDQQSYSMITIDGGLYLILIVSYTLQIAFLAYQFIPLANEFLIPEKTTSKSNGLLMQNSVRDDVLQKSLGLAPILVNLGFALWFIVQPINFFPLTAVSLCALSLASWVAYLRVKITKEKSDGVYLCMQLPFAWTAAYVTCYTVFFLADNWFPFDPYNPSQFLIPCIVTLCLVSLVGASYALNSNDYVFSSMLALCISVAHTNGVLRTEIRYLSATHYLCLILLLVASVKASLAPKSNVGKVKMLNVFTFVTWVSLYFVNLGYYLKVNVISWITPAYGTYLIWVAYFGLTAWFCQYQYSRKGSPKRDTILLNVLGNWPALTGLLLSAYIFSLEVENAIVRFVCLIALAGVSGHAYQQVNNSALKSGVDIVVLQSTFAIVSTWSLYLIFVLISWIYFPYNDGDLDTSLVPNVILLLTISGGMCLYTFLKKDIIPALVLVAAVGGITFNTLVSNYREGSQLMRQVILLSEFVLFAVVLLTPFLSTLKKYILKV